MAVDPLSCPDCGAGFDAPDNYCRRCGMYLADAHPLPVTAGPAPRALELRRPSLPAPVARAATAVAVGAALQIGLGLAGRYLVRQAAQHAVSAARPRPRPRNSSEPARAAANPASVPTAAATTVTETLVIRRTWLRRHMD